MGRILLICMVLLAWPATSAVAAASGPTIAVRPGEVVRGQSVRIEGRGWPRSATVRLLIGPPASEGFPVGQARVDARGRFVKRVTLRAPGRWVVIACIGATCASKASAHVRVTVGQPRRPGGVTLLHSELPRATYRERPGAVGYRRGTAFDLALDRVELRRLIWSGWGRGRARADGRARVCGADGRCSTIDATVVASRRVRYESREWFYARLRLRLGAPVAGAPRTLGLCTLPAICGGVPTPP